MTHKIPYTKATNPEEAYVAAKGQITPEYIEKFKVKASIDYDESGKSIQAKGKGFTLTLNFKASETEVELELSLMLRAFKGSILDTITKKLTRHV